jgi:hypothetical protein
MYNDIGVTGGEEEIKCSMCVSIEVRQNELSLAFFFDVLLNDFFL